MMQPRRLEKPTNDHHRAWLILAVAVAVLALAVLFLYPSIKETLFGQAITPEDYITNIPLASWQGSADVYTGSPTSPEIVIYYKREAPGIPRAVNICDCRNSVCPTYDECAGTSSSAETSEGIEVTLADGQTCYLVDGTNFPADVDLYQCGASKDRGFNIDVQCPDTTTAPGQQFTCDLVLDRTVVGGDNNVFGAQFVINAVGLQEGDPFITAVSADPEDPVQAYSMGIGQPAIIFRTSERDTLSGPLAQISFVALGPNSYTVSLSDFIVVTGSIPDTVTVIGQPVVGGTCSSGVSCAAAQGLPVACVGGICGGLTATCSNNIQCASGYCNQQINQCAVRTEICDNTIDDDSNGFTDCADISCEGELSCSPVVVGDVNDDGSISIVDAILLLRHIAGISVLTSEQQQAADVNACQSGQIGITIVDAILILRSIAGIAVLPC